MGLQLNLLPYAYYNTLGFEPALIDYIDHVDDTFLLDIIDPLYRRNGRLPASPITYFRMHYLYFTRPEITSFRELCRQLKDHKNQAWRNFIGVPNPARVPSHQSLSEFRSRVGPERFEQIRNEFIRQAAQTEGFIQDTLAAIDSRPIYANVNGYKKKRCGCEDKKSCGCEKTFSDPDATYGVQRSKANQNKFFIGYRKHSITCATSQGPIALMSIIKPNNIHDVNIMLPLIEEVRKIRELHVQYLVADLGYLDAEDQKNAFHEHDMAVVTGFKSNTVLPESCDTRGRPECEQGYRLLWDGFDKDTATSWFRGDESYCQGCPLQGACEKQFGYAMDENPVLYGPVPQDTAAHERMLNFRKQIELSFAIESNGLTTVMKHKKVPVRGTDRVQSFFAMQDMSRLVTAQIAHLRETKLPKEHRERLTQMRNEQYEQLVLDIVA
jgi:transposase